MIDLSARTSTAARPTAARPTAGPRTAPTPRRARARRPRVALAFVAALLVVASACGRAPGSWTEILGAARGGDVVVEAPDDRLAALARRAVADATHGGRLVAVRLDAPEAEAWLERLGAERAADGGWILCGVTFGGAGELVHACFEDPDAPGAPLVLYLGDDDTLAAHLARAEPPARRPGVRVVADGAVVLRAPLRRGGAVVASEAERIKTRASFRRHAIEGALAEVRPVAALGVVRGTRVSEERANAYLTDAAVALENAVAWCGAGPSGAWLELHARGVGFAEAGGRDEFGAVDPTGRRVVALLAAGLPDDGGAALAEAYARRAWGPPASTETACAFGVAAAGRYWGRALEAWSGEGELAPLARTADLARRLRRLAESGALDDLRAVWNGDLARLAPVPVPHVAPAARASAPGELLGVAVELPPAPLVDREDLSRDVGRAAGVGANGASVSCTVLQNAPLPERVGEPRPAAGRTAQGDALFAAFLDEARVAGLGRLTVRPRVMEWDSGYDVARRKTTTVAGWDEIFAGYVAAYDHVAEIAELVGAEQFVVGEGLYDATRTELDDGTGLPEDVLAAKRAGWDRVVDRVRARFGGGVLYVADWPGEATRLAIWDRFDAVAIAWYPTLRTDGDRALSTPELRNAMSSRVDAMARLAEEQGMPWQIARFGVPSARGAARDGRDPFGPPDEEEQSRVYAAFAHALRTTARPSPGYQGVSLSGWSGTGDAGPRSDRVAGRAAQAMLGRVFGAEGDGE